MIILIGSEGAINPSEMLHNSAYKAYEFLDFQRYFLCYGVIFRAEKLSFWFSITETEIRDNKNMDVRKCRKNPPTNLPMLLERHQICKIVMILKYLHWIGSRTGIGK